MELDEESSYLTTFNSPFGRYRFLRMPFGLKMSQGVFQSKIDQLMEGCVGTTGIADDMIVYAETEEERDQRLHGLMLRCAENCLNLNPEKCNIKQQEIIVVLRKKGSKTKERMKEEEIEKGDCGLPTWKVYFWDFVGLEPSGT